MVTLGEVKRSNIIKFRLPRQFLRFFIPNFCVFSQMKNTKHIRRDFHSVTWVMSQGWNFERWGCPGIKNIIFKHGHVAYQIDGDDEQNRIHTSKNFILGSR